MIEVIFGLIALTVLIYSISKLIKRRKKLNQDLLLEDIDTIHYGPFSGQYSIRRYILTLLLCSSQVVFAGIDLRTIDNWGIDSWGSDALMLQKTSDSTKSNLYIEMSRPFCICTDPIITTPVAKSTYNTGDKIKATMTVDNYKPVDIIFEVDSILDDDDYLLRPKYYPSLRYASIVKIKFENSSPLDDISFNTKGMTNAMKQSEKICLSIFELEESEMKDTRNI
jgi:hypothetical protein